MPDAVLAKRHTRDLTHELAAVEVSARWTPARKQILLELIRRGAVTVAQACERFDLSAEEVASWMRRDEAHGRTGLAVTKLQEVGRG